jgi:uncharacterized protein YbaR (Trm112 family)
VIDKELLEVLVCPKTHKPLSLAEQQLVTQLNDWISSGKLKDAAGQVVQSRIDGGLLCREAGLLYPILDGIPVLLVDAAIPLDQLGHWSAAKLE